MRNEEKKPFTLEASLRLAAGNLIGWKAVLKPEIYERVAATVAEKNKGAVNPYAVCRGSEIDFIVRVIAHEAEPEFHY